MRHQHHFGWGHFLRSGFVALAVLMLATVASAQTGRVGGQVKDDTGQPIKGATVTAENPSASPSSFTATTDDKGRFSIIGLKTGRWTFTAQAPSFAPESGGMNVQTIGAPNPPLTFTLKKGGGAAPMGALGGIAAKDLQADLAAADQLYNAQQWDGAITAYRAIMAKAPSLSVINLQIAAAYRNKKEFDRALDAYHALLIADPTNEQAKIGIVAAARGRETFARIPAALERVGLLSRADDRVKTYSMGMRQRLGIARCLLADPELLILDEPMNGLDPAGILDFRHLIRALVGEGRTVVLSSHILDEVEKTCDYVAIVDRGEIVAMGPLAELQGEGKPKVLIGVDGTPAALEILAAVPGVSDLHSDNGVIQASVADPEVIPELNRRLVEAGIPVRRLEPLRASLEERFLAITSKLGEDE